MPMKLNNSKRSVATLIMATFVSLSSLGASDTLRTKSRGWYAGIEGGIAIGYSTFDSSGDGTLRPGWATGVFGGYRFNPWLSAELSLKYAQMRLTAQDCCVRRDYWLGSDGAWYGAPVLGLNTWNYADLKSHVMVGQYGARLNFDALGLFEATRKSRWSFNISPQFYAISSKAKIQTQKGSVTVFRPSTKWHFGGGFSVIPSVHVGQSLVLGAYTGFTFVTGKRIDGMSKHLHINNMIWDSGLKLSYAIPTHTKRTKHEEPANTPISPTPMLVVVSPQENPEPVVPPADEPKADTVHSVAKVVAEKADTVAVQPQAGTAVVQPQTETEAELPAIYFAFNRYSLQQKELPKLRVILKYLKDNPDVKVTLQGWCDTRGPVYVNSRLSRQRAARVKSWLMQHGIAANRLSIVGNGSDFKTTNHSKARRVVTEQNGKSKRAVK